MNGVTQACFGLSYLFALLLEVAGTRWPRAGLRSTGLLFGAAGLFAQTLFLAYHRPSPATPYGSLLLLAWVLAVFYFYGSLHHARQAWAIFVLPVVLGLVGLSIALANAASGPPPVNIPDWLHGERLWGAIHGLLFVLAAVGISVSFLASVMYLFQARRLRMKKPPLGVLHLLSLERLEEMNRRAVNAAVPLLTAGLVLGGLLLRRDHAPEENWLSLKVLGTAGLWAACVLLVVDALCRERAGPAARLAQHSHLHAPGDFAGGDASVRGGGMNLRAIGCNFRTAAVEVREKLAFDAATQAAAASELAARFGCEVAILSTCNRVELYVGGETPFDSEMAAEFLAERHRLDASLVRPLLYAHAEDNAVRHLFRVAASLDSLVLGEGQIAGQVKQTFEAAKVLGTAGPLLHALFPYALRARQNAYVPRPALPAATPRFPAWPSITSARSSITSATRPSS